MNNTVTTVFLSTEYGVLSKRARFTGMEIDDEKKLMFIYYREELVDADGKVVTASEKKLYVVSDREAVYYKPGEVLSPTSIDENGNEVNIPILAIGEEIKEPAFLEFTDWDNNLGKPVIRPAIVNRLKKIYGLI